MQKLVFLCLTLGTYLLSGQAIAGHDVLGAETPNLYTPVCYASDEIEKVFIPPPVELISLKSAEVRMDIIVSYNSFPEDAKVAFEYAVAIWERLIDSPVPIHIDVKWVEKGTNVLGSCRPASYEKNFDGTPLPDIYYPVALAEKVAGRELNGSGQPDIVAEFNSDMSWYFGIDGDTPVQHYDFVSVVLHELTHGLGFIGFFFSMNENGNYGYLRMGDATVYDLMVVRMNGERLTDASVYENPSVALKSAMLSGDLFSNSPVASEVEGSRPRLYSPPVWINGSSIYHLDRTAYPSTGENSLMRPTLAKGQAVHNPGPVTLGIMADLGWKADQNEMAVGLEIVHQPIPFLLDKKQPMPVEVLVKEVGKVDTIFVEYTLNGISQQSFGLVSDANARYSANFPLAADYLHAGDEIAYRIVAVDAQTGQNVRKFPDGGQYAFRVEELYEPVFGYHSDFENVTSDFILGGFSITSEDGFSGRALHSAHPYNNSPDVNRDINAVSYLKYPVILTSGTILSYDEVVLVEPGMIGSGSEMGEFADFVIVEASKNSGKTWLPLIDGYNAGDNALWSERYYASIVNHTSLVAGRQEWYSNRSIDMQQVAGFSEGDTIIIRFRLSANTEANGWGWAIDNLSIQSTVSASDNWLTAASFNAYPNPFQQKFRISTDLEGWIDRLELDVYNAYGQKVWTGQSENVSGKIDWDVDTQDGLPGIYLLVVRQNGEQVYTRKMIRN